MTNWNRVWLACWGLCAGAGLSLGAEVSAKVETPRGLQTLLAEGDAPAGATQVEVRLHLGQAEALRVEVDVVNQRWSLLRRCSPQLVPTTYQLSVRLPDDSVWAKGELRVGTEADEARARVQEREYFRGVVQEIAAQHGGLEDRVWLNVESKELVADDLITLCEVVKRSSRSTGTSLRMFDLRVAQPFLPGVRAQFEELLVLLRARADAWIAFAEKPGDAPPPQDPRVKAIAEELAAALELPAAELAGRFGRSDLGYAENPVSSEGGRWTSVLGFSIELPAGAVAVEAIERKYAPDVRLLVTLPSVAGAPPAQVLVRVVRMPFAVTSFEKFTEFVEVENWEREGLFTGYRRLVAAPDPKNKTFRLRFTGHLRDAQTAEGEAVEGQQVALYDPLGRRALIGFLFGEGADTAVLESMKWEDK